MKGSSNYSMLFAVLASLLAVSCAMPVRDGPRNYDVGCYKEMSDIIAREGYLAFVYNTLPTCMEGGLYKNLQCKGGECYCAYVDNGQRIPNIHINQYSTWYNELASMCPIRTSQLSDSCSIPPVSYPCKVSDPKFKFDPSTGSCSEVPYGCFGHATLEACETNCVPKVYDQCTFPTNRGYRCSRAKSGMRWRHDEASGECREFAYRGCGGNSNNYETKWQCEKRCVEESLIDFQVAVTSIGKYNLTAPSWVIGKYNLDLSEASAISREKFDEIREDSVTAKLVAEEKPDVRNREYQISSVVLEEETRPIFCSFPAKTGPCRAYFPRWFYNHTAGTCDKFVFGGCLPNENNFKKLEDCETTCNAKYNQHPSVIAAPPRPGAGNINGVDPHLTGATVVHRVGHVDNSGYNNLLEPRASLMSDGPSGSVESST